jgi:hypothetical protein
MGTSAIGIPETSPIDVEQHAGVCIASDVTALVLDRGGRAEDALGWGHFRTTDHFISRLIGTAATTWTAGESGRNGQSDLVAVVSARGAVPSS